MGSFHTKEVNCRCGATLQWSDLRKAWYCIECPFNTFPKNAESFEAKEIRLRQKSIYHECFKCGHKTESKWMTRQQDRKCPKCFKDEGWTDVQTMIGYEDSEATNARRKKEKLEKLRKLFEESGLADWEELWEERKKKYDAESLDPPIPSKIVAEIMSDIFNPNGIITNEYCLDSYDDVTWPRHHRGSADNCRFCESTRQWWRVPGQPYCVELDDDNYRYGWTGGERLGEDWYGDDDYLDHDYDGHGFVLGSFHPQYGSMQDWKKEPKAVNFLNDVKRLKDYAKKYPEWDFELEGVKYRLTLCLRKKRKYQNAESFSADEQKACHRCGNTEKDGKLWWVGSRKGFICGDCSDDGKKYRAESGCANCDKESHFTDEDLPVGPRSFCSEKCWAEYVGMPIHPEGYYGLVGKELSLSAESTNSQTGDELALERTELSRLRSEFSAKRTAMSGIRTILAIGTFILVLATFKHRKDTNS